MSLELDFLVRVVTQALWLSVVLVVLVDLCRRRGEFLSFCAAMLALGMIGYASFWFAFANYRAFGILKIALLAAILFRFAIIVYRRRLRDYGWLAEPLIFTCLFFAVVITLAFANGGLNDPGTVARTRLSEILPLDNVIPLMIAIGLKAGHIASPLFGDWLGSDRPPLQVGLYLFLTLQTTDLSYQIVASLLQATFLLGAWGVLTAMGIAGAPRRLALLACCLLPIAIVNTLYTWPKMLAAGYLLLVFALLFCQPPRDDAGRGMSGALLGGLLGGLAALAALSHGASFFPLIGFAVTVLVFWAWPPIRTTMFGALTFLALYLPWVLYQRFIDPPGNRLLKWHLAGVTAVDDRGLVTALRDAYGALSWQDYAAGKITNLKVLLGPAISHLFDLADLLLGRRSDLVATIRTADFFNFVPSMHALSIAVLIAIALLPFMPAEDRPQRDLLLRLLIAAVATLGALVAVIFIPGQTINHVGSYATQIMVAIFAISVLALRARPLAIAFVSLQAVTVGAVYGVSLKYDPNFWPLIAVGVVSTAGLVSYAFYPYFGKRSVVVSKRNW